MHKTFYRLVSLVINDKPWNYNANILFKARGIKQFTIVHYTIIIYYIIIAYTYVYE